MEIKEMENVYKDIKKLNDIKLIVFDMDGVLLKNRNSWDVLIDKISGNKIKRDKMIYTFDYLYRHNIPAHLYNSLRSGNMARYLNLNDISPNLHMTMEEIKKMGIKTAIVSAGVHEFAEYLGTMYGFDYAIGNQIDTENMKIVKNVDPLKKDYNVRLIQKTFGIDKDETLSVGDSFMDLSMKRASRYFIAFNPSNVEMLKYSDFSVKSNNLFEIIKTIKWNIH
ncbi:HAD family hydrolase [Acidiplasma cupricumulans]|uniref:phosphoserine phosphatase n=4 Tax=Ferroplasmaceae TaxID=90142 RepID=A0A0Q0WIH1_9ARCH|nr:HAD-IB family phosphatase [Acidiplasma cupricumulans]KQB35385.1 hypothetical protein AOG55_06955 [Acidiplasma cupricumulans]